MSTPMRPHPDEDGHARGRHIENRLLRYLIGERERGAIADFFQPDAAVVRTDETLCFVESKGQAHFKAPPFDGHGLPVKQANLAQHVYYTSEIPTMLMVFEDARLFIEWLHVLERGETFDTAGTIKTPRRVYPLTSFRRLR